MLKYDCCLRTLAWSAHWWALQPRITEQMKESQLKVMLIVASAWLCLGYLVTPLVTGQADLSSWVHLVMPWVYMVGWTWAASLKNAVYC